jgi:hypothetical protein
VGAGEYGPACEVVLCVRDAGIGALCGARRMAREERGSPGFHMVVVAVWKIGIGEDVYYMRGWEVRLLVGIGEVPVQRRHVTG